MSVRRLVAEPDTYEVDSHSSSKMYLVRDTRTGWTCDCTAWAIKRNKIKAGSLRADTDPDCKHIKEVKIATGDSFASPQSVKPDPIDETKIQNVLQSLQQQLNDSKFAEGK